MSAHQPGPWKRTPPFDELRDANGERVVFSHLSLAAGYAGDRMAQIEANDRLVEAAPDTLAERDALAAQVEEAKALLRGLQWAAGDADMCPACRGWKDTEDERRWFDAHQGIKHWGHMPGCVVAAFLGRKGTP